MRLSQNDLFRLRTFLINQLHNFDYYILSFTLRAICLDNSLQSGEITRVMFSERILMYERQSLQPSQNLNVDLSQSHLVELRLLELSYPMRVIAMRKLLEQVVRLAEIQLGMLFAYDFPLLCRSI